VNDFAEEIPIDDDAPPESEKRDVPRVITVRELLEASMDRALSKRDNRQCTTGNYELDEATGGMRPGHVWVFGADTNWGKSSFLVMLADENIKRGKRVLIVSSEDDESIYGDRLMVRRARVRALAYRDRKLNGDEIDRVTRVAKDAPDVPVFLDARGKSAERIAKDVGHIIATEKIDMVAYDYLQEFRSGVRHQDRRNEVSEVAAALRMPVKTAGITGIIFSQITVSEAKKYPDKHSIRESRDVSNAAEVIMLGFTPSSAISTRGGANIEAGSKAILIDKAKDGIKRTVQMKWDEQSACFDTQESPEMQRYAEYHEGFEEG